MNNKIEIDFTPLAIALDNFTISAEEAMKSFSTLNKVSVADISSTVIRSKEEHKLIPMTCCNCGGGIGEDYVCKMCGTRFMKI